MFTKENLYIIGERIYNARKSQHLNQDALAKISGVSKSTISRIENGHSIKKEQLVKISNALNLNPSDVFGIDTVSDNIDDFIALFCKILYSYDDEIETNGIISPAKLICSYKNKLVLYMNNKLVNLFKDIAQAYVDTQDIKDQKLKDVTYTEKLKEAKEKYNATISLGVKPYYLISEDNLAQIISKAINEQKNFDDIMKSLLLEEKTK